MIATAVIKRIPLWRHEPGERGARSLADAGGVAGRWLAESVVGAEPGAVVPAAECFLIPPFSLVGYLSLFLLWGLASSCCPRGGYIGGRSASWIWIFFFILCFYILIDKKTILIFKKLFFIDFEYFFLCFYMFKIILIYAKTL